MLKIRLEEGDTFINPINSILDMSATPRKKRKFVSTKVGIHRANASESARCDDAAKSARGVGKTRARI